MKPPGDGRSSEDKGRELRSSLSNVGGTASYRGDESFAHPMRRILEAADDPAPSLAIHAFHSYPARMHPHIAREAVAAFAPEGGGSMLDPFCGGGTTIVEAMRAGWRTLASDINPLALALTRVRSTRRGEAGRERLLAAIEGVAQRSEDRVRGRVDVRAKLDAEERSWYEVHVLKELAGLLLEIDALEPAADREALRMVFSAIVVKFSKQRADTSHERVEKRIRKGLPTEFFARKGVELVEAWAELDAACEPKTRRPSVVRSDVRRLGQTLSGDFRADLILTSPPYGGTYDYADHHARRLAWLGMNAQAFRRDEIGSRRELAKARDGERRWAQQVEAMLAALAPRLSARGVALLVMGDGQVGGGRVPADRQIERLCVKAGLRFVGVASQSRRDYAGGAERNEHLIALELA